jgi:hypothetical protein
MAYGTALRAREKNGDSGLEKERRKRMYSVNSESVKREAA